MKKKTKNLIVWDVKEKKGFLSPDDFVNKAADFGLTSILIEGGSGVATSFMKAGLIDKYVVVISPKIIGRGIDTIGDLNIKKISSAIEFDEYQFNSSYSPDNVFIGYPAKGDND